MGAPRFDPDSQAGFGGGLNVTADRFSLAESEIRRAENARLGDAAELRKRRGTRLLQAAALAGVGATPVRGGFGWVQPNAAAIEIAACGGQLHTATYGLPTTWTPRAGGIDATAVPCFAAFRDASMPVVYVADGGPLNKITAAGAVSTNLAGTPAVTGCIEYNQRLVAWGDAAAPSQLYVSDFGNGDTCGVTGSGGLVFVVETYGEGEIVACGVAQGTLFIFHPSGISTYTGITVDDITIGSDTQGLTGDVGCAAARSVVSLEMGVLFLSQRGFYLATPAGVSPVSGTINAALRDLDRSQWARVWGVHARRRNEVLFYLPDVGIYAYSYRADGSGAWMGPWKGAFVDPATHALWESEDAQGRPIVLRGGADGKVDVIDYKTPSGRVLDRIAADGTGGTPFTLATQCRPLTHGDLGLGKGYEHAIVTADLDGSTQAGFTYRTASGAGNETFEPEPASTWGGTTWGGGVWGGDGMTTYTARVQGHGPYLDLTLVDGGDREIAIARVDVNAFSLGRRRYA
jgi:hypothetical protein